MVRFASRLSPSVAAPVLLASATGWATSSLGWSRSTSGAIPPWTAPIGLIATARPAITGSVSSPAFAVGSTSVLGVLILLGGLFGPGREKERLQVEICFW